MPVRAVPAPPPQLCRRRARSAPFTPRPGRWVRAHAVHEHARQALGGGSSREERLEADWLRGLERLRPSLGQPLIGLREVQRKGDQSKVSTKAPVRSARASLVVTLSEQRSASRPRLGSARDGASTGLGGGRTRAHLWQWLGHGELVACRRVRVTWASAGQCRETAVESGVECCAPPRPHQH